MIQRQVARHTQGHAHEESAINPYNPSTVDLPEIIAGPIRRPYSVWAFQAVLALILVMFIFGVYRQLGAVSRGEIPTLILLVDVVILLVFASPLYFIHRGLRFARWLGVAMIVALAGFSILGSDATHYASDAERMGGLVGRRIIMPLLCAWWLYAFGFSTKAKRYFSRTWSGSRIGDADEAEVT